jgi:methylated-DNA-[protein]-cysteine S-methyltransferase
VQIELSHLESPVGRVALAVCGDALCILDFAETDASILSRLQRWYGCARLGTGPGATRIAQRVRAYFAGELSALHDIRVETPGTDFQRRVWAALREVPVGTTMSYRGIATAIGSPAAVRAVGSANGRNPVALVVPCHRVIASNGTLCGYAGGLWRKKWLLQHEGASLA